MALGWRRAVGFGTGGGPRPVLPTCCHRHAATGAQAQGCQGGARGCGAAWAEVGTVNLLWAPTLQPGGSALAAGAALGVAAGFSQEDSLVFSLT